MNDRLMKSAEVMKLFGITRNTLYAWVNDGRLPKPIRFGKAHYRWRESDITDFIAKRSME